jgi:crossover junction endodeoxyribonuclease RuvC
LIIVGFDPGTATTGFGVIQPLPGGKILVLEHGVILTPAGVAPPMRLHKIYREVCGILDRYEPGSVATERLFFSKNETTALSVGRTIGVILLAIAERKLPWTEYTPLQVKQAVTGVGSADKKQIQFMVTRILGLKETPKPDDAADALAVAICHCNMLGPAAMPAAGQPSRRK